MVNSKQLRLDSSGKGTLVHCPASASWYNALVQVMSAVLAQGKLHKTGPWAFYYKISMKYLLIPFIYQNNCQLVKDI